MREHYHRDYSTRVKAGGFSDVNGKAYYLSRFQAILKEKEADWKRLQISVVAGGRIQTCALQDQTRGQSYCAQSLLFRASASK